VISFLRAIADPTLWESPLRATTALFAALACTIVLGSALRRHSLFGSKRFRLSPVDGDALLLARVVLGNPVRLLAVAAVLLWGLRVVIARDSHVLSSSLDVGALLALCVIAMLSGQEWSYSDRSGRDTWSPIAAMLCFILIGCALLVFSRPVSQEPAVLPVFSGLLFASSPTWNRFAWVLGLLSVAMVSLRRALRYDQIRAGEAQTTGRGASARAAAPRRRARMPLATMLLQRAPWVACEVAVVRRFAHARVSVAISILCAVIAFASDSPVFFAFAFLGWVDSMFNVFGVDLPLHGSLRYTLVGVPNVTVTARRHVVRVASTAGIALVTYFGLWIAQQLSGVGLEPRSLGMHSAFLAYGASVYYLLSVSGDALSLRYPRAIVRRLLTTPPPVGSARMTIFTFASIAGSTVVAAMLFFTSQWLVGLSGPPPQALVLIVAAALNIFVWRIAIYAKSSGRSR
jgi:hypothetical protein